MAAGTTWPQHLMQHTELKCRRKSSLRSFRLLSFYAGRIPMRAVKTGGSRMDEKLLSQIDDLTLEQKKLVFIRLASALGETKISLPELVQVALNDMPPIFNAGEAEIAVESHQYAEDGRHQHANTIAHVYPQNERHIHGQNDSETNAPTKSAQQQPNSPNLFAVILVLVVLMVAVTGAVLSMTGGAQ